MSNLLKTELYKLTHSWYFWGIGLLNFFLSSVLLLDSCKETENLFLASLYNTPILYFLIIVFATLFIGADFEQRTLYSYISAGQKRSHVMFVKTFIYEVASFFILAFPLLIHGLIGSLFFNETVVMDNTLFITIITIIVSLLALCMLPLLFSFIFRDIGKTLVVPIAIFFLIIFLMNGAQAHFLSQIIPMGQLRLISLQQSSFSDMKFILIDFVWVIILYLCAYFGFRHADLK